MTIKQIVNDLLNKKCSLEDLFWLIFMCVIFSTFTTPFLGIPIGVIAYFFFFYKDDDDVDEIAEKYDYQDENKK
ncbi:VraH family protein (plasmid) [Staphylococcus aureus]|uniref:VraH family peptide resistance protein n=1 Tax=Staphylococcus aureus TaxID=1280 RepID=UPI0021D1207B|nr:VraH family protein [Staphylococcus aureus]UXU38079.1 VraH family protein [Staphylococcus aureus]